MKPKILDKSKSFPEVPAKAAIIAPTMITEEMALVTDIKGVEEMELHSIPHSSRQKLIK